MAIFQTSDEAGKQVRRRGQAIASGEYNPGDVYRQQRGREYVPGQEAAEYLSQQRRAAITPPPAAAPSPQSNQPSLSDSDRILQEIQSRYKADAQAQASAKPESKGTFLGDVGRSLGRGAISVAGGVNEVANLVTLGAPDAAAKYISGTTPGEVLGRWRNELNAQDSTELQAQRAELEQAKGFVDSFTTILTNPRLAGSMVFEMGPQLATVALAARTAAARAFSTATASGLSAGAAATAATTSATRTVLGLNAAIEGGSAGMDARQNVMTMSEDELSKSPQYQQLVSQFGDTQDGRKQARERLANDASAVSASLAATISLISGGVTGAGKLEAKVLTGQVASEIGERTAGKVVTEIGKGVVKEGAQEAIEEGGSQFATNVGTRYSGAKPDQDLLEGVPQAAGSGAALGVLAGGGFGTVSAIRGSKPADVTPPPADQSSQTQQTQQTQQAQGTSAARPPLTEAEYGAAVNSPAYMAAAWTRADEAGRARIQTANPDLNFGQLAQNDSLLSEGNSLIDNNPDFFADFTTRLSENTTNPAARADDPPFDGGTMRDAPPDPVPVRERMKMAQSLADEGQAIAEGQFSREKPLSTPAPDTLSAGPSVQLPGQPPLDIQLRGYERRAENLMSMPEGARRAAATSSMQEMISRGFTPEQAQSVFGSITNPQQGVVENVEEVDAAPPPADLDFTQEDIRPKIDPKFQTFAQVSERMAQRDLEREPTAKPADYIETPVPPQIRELAKRFGVQVYGFRYAGNNKLLRTRRGSSLSGSVMLINADAQDNHMAIFGHELYHELRRRNPEAAAQLEQEILSYVTQPGKEALAQRLLNRGYDISKIDEEMTADLMGYMFTEKEFWAELSQKQPTLVDKIIQVIDDMLYKFGFKTERNAFIAEYVTDMQQVREMLIGFISESQGGTDLDFTSDGAIDNAFEGTSDEDKQTLEQVRSLLVENKVPEAAKLFSANKLMAKTGVKFTDLQKENDQKVSTERQQTSAEQSEANKVIEDNEKYIAQQRKALGIADPNTSQSDQTGSEEETPVRYDQGALALAEAEKNVRAVVELLRLANNKSAEKGVRNKALIEANKLFKASSLSAFGEDFKELEAAVQAEGSKKISQAIFNAEPQGDLRLKRDITKFDAQVAEIMSGETARVKEKKAQRKDASIKRGQEAKRKALDDRITEDYNPDDMPDTTLDDDTGGVMTQLAMAGSLGGAEGQIKAEKKTQEAEDEAAAGEADVAENASIMNARVRALTSNIDRSLGRLTKVRERMAKEGFSESEINATVGKAEADLQALRDGELSQLVNEQLRDSRPSVSAAEATDKDPEELPGSNEIQAELDFNDQQRTEARRLVDAVAKKEMNLEEAFRAVRDNDIGVMHLLDQMREAGIEVGKKYIDLSGNIAANHTLEGYIERSGMSPYFAREAWLKAYDNVPIKSLVPLSDTEKTAYENWKNNRKKYMQRLSDQVKDNASFSNGSLEELFPNALFNQFSLSEMRNPDTITEVPLRQMIRDLFPDPVRAWLQDISDVLSVRPDLEGQVNEALTKEEQEAYNDFFTRQVREAMRDLDMKMRSPVYSQLDQLRYLSPEMWMDYRSKIAKADENQFKAILHEAAELNDIAKAAIENGEDRATIAPVLDARMKEAMARDDTNAKDLDDISDSLDDNSVRYRRGRFSGVVGALTLQEHFNLIFSKWDTAPAYTVAQNPNQLPADVRNRLMSRFENGSFKGAIDPKTGHIYIFSEFSESVEDAEFTMFHELYGHWGMRAFLGDSIDSFLNNQYKVNQKVREAADRLAAEAKENGMPMTKLESIEEAIADQATEGNASAFRELMGRLVRWLKKHGMNSVASWLDSTGSSELAYVMSQARKVAMSKQGISPLDGAPSDVMYNRSKKMPVEGYAIRDGKVTGYTRINPVNGYWTVFTLNDGAESLASGNYTVHTVEELVDAHDLLKKVGQVNMSRDRSTRQEVDPKNVAEIPNFSDLSGWARFKRNMLIQGQNMFLPIFEVAKFLEGKGIKNSVIDDLIKYESRTKWFIDNYEKEFANPINRLMGEAGKKGATLEDIDLFLMARHAEERNRVIKAINPKNSRGSGLDTKEAQKILNGDNDGKWSDFRTELDEIGRLMDAMSQAKLSYMLNTGLINKYQYESLSRYKHYVNLSGNQELDLDKYDTSQLGGRSFNVRGSDIIRATGRGTVAVDVLQNTMNSYLATIIRGQKNRPLQAILQMFEQNPDQTYVKVEKINRRKQINIDRLSFDKKILSAIGDAPTDESGREYLVGLQRQMKDGSLDSDDAMAELVRRINEAEARRDISPDEAARAVRNVNEQVVISARLSPDGYVTTVETPGDKDRQVVVKVNGKPITMEFNGKSMDFFDAITGMNVTQNGPFIEAVAVWNRLFSQMVTTMNPAWVPVNMVRDIQTAFANAAADPEVGAELAGKMFMEWKRSHRIAFRHLVAEQADAKQGWWGNRMKASAQKNPLSDAERQWINEFFEDGAATYFIDRGGLEQTIDKLNRHLNPMTLGKIRGVKDAGVWTTGKFDAIADLMDLIGTPAEIAPRLAAYKVLREAGRSREEAARYAKELTVNFNMKGAYKPLRALYVFANPAIQGTMRMFKDAKEGNYARFGAVAAGWITMGMISSMIADAFGDDDEEERKDGLRAIDKVPDYKRATSITFLPDTYFGSIPVAYGWNVFSTMGQYAYDTAMGYRSAASSAGKVVKAAFDSFAPIGSGVESKTFLGQAGKTLLPSPLVPMLELGLNENRFGAPISKGDSDFSDIKESDAYKHFDSVNPISKSLMHFLAEATSGEKNPRYNSSLIDVNPATVDYLINSYLPGLISSMYQGVGKALNAAAGRDTKEQDLPVLGRFKAKIDQDSFNAGAYRRVKEEVNTSYKEYMAPETSDARKREIVKAHPRIGEMQAMFSGIEQQMKQMSKNLEAIERDPNRSDRQKVELRNEYEAMRKEWRARAVKAALERGFTAEVIDDR